MNEVIECLLTRRSVRSYLPKQVEEEKLQEILLAGTYAGQDRRSAGPCGDRAAGTDECLDPRQS